MSANQGESAAKRKFDRDRIQRDYAHVVGFYDLWSRLTETKTMQKVLDLSEVGPNESVLEVAVGTGRMFAELLKKNKMGRTIGVDLTLPMLRRAAQRLTSGERIFLSQAEASQLPFRSQQFDLIVNNYMFDLLPEQRFIPMLNEFKRVLRRPARIVLSTMSHGDKWVHAFWRALARAFPGLLTGCRPVRLRPYLQRAGFSNIQTFGISQNTFPSEVLKADIRT